MPSRKSVHQLTDRLVGRELRNIINPDRAVTGLGYSVAARLTITSLIMTIYFEIFTINRQNGDLACSVFGLHCLSLF